MSDAAALAVELAGRLPAGDIARLADAAALGPDGLAGLRIRAANPVLRDACTSVAGVASVAPERLAGLLLGAAAATSQERAQVDVVWTGPRSDVQTGRLTGPLVAEIVDSATHEVLLVSFASRDEPRLVAALTGAIARGVDVTVLMERDVDNPSYRGAGAFDGLPVRRWIWAAGTRPAGAALHAKILVADGDVALVGSANLTGRALDTNLECGVVVRGGPQPGAIRDHLWSLRYRGVLTEP